MLEKFIVTIYQKIDLNDHMIIFRRAGVVTDVYIDLNKELGDITFYDSQKKRITLEYMENPYIFVSDDQFCYGYPLLMRELRKMYPNVLNDDALAEKYLEEVSRVVNIGILDDRDDSMKILVTNEETLKNSNVDDIFKDFCVSYDSRDEETIILQLNDFRKMMDLADKGEYELVKKKAQEVLDILNRIHQDKQQSNEGYFLTGKEGIEDILKELNSLTGLNNIKSEINKLMKYLIFRDKVREKLNLEVPNLHMFFSGNPGTGKTTVAKIVGKLLYQMGYIKKNIVAEITPKDLIAGYVGQTALKTSKFLQENRGGVIFIDEAYAFASDAQRFAGEALVEILKELEKNETVFIFAGYKDEMDMFMSMNPGLTSRIGYYLEYHDYTKEELLEIFEHKVKKIGFFMDDRLKEKVSINLDKAMRNQNFGNGRYIDKLINKLVLEHALKTEELSDIKRLVTLSEEDWNDEIEEALIFKSKKRNLGFRFDN